jgi:hypothetical protein
VADPAPPPGAARRSWRALAGRIAVAFAFRYACFAAMIALAVWNEGRPAPHLPDLVIDHLPYSPFVDRWNYVLWLVAYVPVALGLLATDADRFCRYMWSSGLLSLARGVSIVATGLGPVRGEDVNVARLAAPGAMTRAFLEVIDPFGVFFRESAHIYLTKDLYFSGHTATTLLLLLYVWPYPRLRWPMLASHVLVVASVFLSHLHYTIDVIGAYAVAFALFTLREGQAREMLSGVARDRRAW